MDKNYTVMSPIGGSLLNTKVLELSPEDTENYRRLMLKHSLLYT